jgi:hypothetical protein
MLVLNFGLHNLEAFHCEVQQFHHVVEILAIFYLNANISSHSGSQKHLY